MVDIHENIRAAGLACAYLDAERHAALHDLAAHDPDRYPFLMESTAGLAAQSRFDLLLAFPERWISDADFDSPADFFTALDHIAKTDLAAPIPGLPFIGGWFVYLGYEMAQGVEPHLALSAVDDTLPAALAVRCPAAIIHDRRKGRLFVLAEAGNDAQVDAMCVDLRHAAPAGTAAPPPRADWQEEPADDYLRAVAQARDYIHAGDVFQANLSRAWHGTLDRPASPGAIYSRLRAANPAPFSGLVQWRGRALICSSPERLLSITNGQASVRPIAGTRRRHPGHGDQAMTRELITHPKERAEHVMLIDLVRNDLGRICMPGTLAVDELMVVESYAHVHHIVSNVVGTLRGDVGPGSALRAVFPGGTITGCPKVRCMEIIAELEATARGAYTGCFGYLSRCGQMDTNIVIRSLTQRGRRLTLRAGAGIVADSHPRAELEETRHKARGVLHAFAEAGPHG